MTTHKIKETGIINVSGKEYIRLGRDPKKNDHHLDHPAVSGQHAVLKLVGEQWRIYDLDSDNGTYVEQQLHGQNGTYVMQRRVLPGQQGLPVNLNCDTIWIAPYAIIISEKSDGAGPEPINYNLDVVNLIRKTKNRASIFDIIRGCLDKERAKYEESQQKNILNAVYSSISFILCSVSTQNRSVSTLLDLSGTPLSFRPGEFIAVVGGSGAGKSTLLKALLGMDTIKVDKENWGGKVFFNDKSLISGVDSYAFAPLNTIVGYVPQQDDSIHFQLSVCDALNFVTQLRFSSSVTDQQRKEYIQEALKAVHLDNEKLQTKPIAKLSGGQRKRVNIAMEIVMRPRILFLDEPTSGLDPGLDLDMMQLLKDWACGKEDHDEKTIVLITHATENIDLCDFIVFMGRVHDGNQEQYGQLLYFGPPEERKTFFGQEKFSEIYSLVNDPHKSAEFHQQIKLEFLKRDGKFSERRRKTREIAVSHEKTTNDFFNPNWRQMTHQFSILAQRYFLLLRCDGWAFFFQLFQGILVAILLWIVASANSFTPSGVENAPTTLFILSIATVWLGILNATKEIVKEKRIFGRERRYGIMPIPYVFSKLAILGGLGLWQSACLVVLTILIIPPETHLGVFARALPEFLQLPFSLEIEWFITLELLMLAGIALGLLISALVQSLDQATMLMFLAILIQVMFAGILIDVGSASWLTFTYWGLCALGNSLNLENLFAAAGKSNAPILDKIDFAGGVPALVLVWFIIISFTIMLTALTCWRQSQNDKAIIPED